MSYETLELSTHSAYPVALYEFALGTTTWRYASSEADVEVPGIGTFLATTILDEGVSQSGSPDEEDVQITLSRNLEVSKLFKDPFPSEPVYVIIRRFNRGGFDAPVFWVGSVKSSEDVELNQLKLGCLMMAASFKRPGLRLGWQRSCPYALYDNNCKVDPEAYRVDVRPQTVSGVAIFSDTIADLQEGRFRGGYVQWPTEHGSVERRGIDDQVGNALFLLEGTQGIAPGMVISCYPGCPRTTDGCQSFDNLPNYGGFPHMPGTSPFDGNPVF